MQLGRKLSQVTYKPDLFDTKFKLKTTSQNPRKGSDTLYTRSKEACTHIQICMLLCTDITMYHILADHLFAYCELRDDSVAMPLGKRLGKTCMQMCKDTFGDALAAVCGDLTCCAWVHLSHRPSWLGSQDGSEIHHHSWSGGATLYQGRV